MAKTDQPADAPEAPPAPTPVVETGSATPAIAGRLAEIESAGGDNAAERALSGHRAPDTVDLPECALREQDNARALGVSEAR